MSIYLNSLCVARNKMLVLYVSINNKIKKEEKEALVWNVFWTQS